MHARKLLRRILSPMEGVIGPTMRNLLTGLGGLKRQINRFLRVSNALLQHRVFIIAAPNHKATMLARPRFKSICSCSVVMPPPWQVKPQCTKSTIGIRTEVDDFGGPDNTALPHQNRRLRYPQRDSPPCFRLPSF